jgi:hypothetical protein
MGSAPRRIPRVATRSSWSSIHTVWQESTLGRATQESSPRSTRARAAVKRSSYPWNRTKRRPSSWQIVRSSLLTAASVDSTRWSHSLSVCSLTASGSAPAGRSCQSVQARKAGRCKEEKSRRRGGWSDSSRLQQVREPADAHFPNGLIQSGSSQLSPRTRTS